MPCMPTDVDVVQSHRLFSMSSCQYLPPLCACVCICFWKLCVMALLRETLSAHQSHNTVHMPEERRYLIILSPYDVVSTLYIHAIDLLCLFSICMLILCVMALLRKTQSAHTAHNTVQHCWYYDCHAVWLYSWLMPPQKRFVCQRHNLPT